MRLLRLAALLGISSFILACPETPPNPNPDTQAPTIASFSPAEGAVDVAFDAKMTATFSEAIAADGLSATLRQGTTNIAGTAALSADRKSLTFTPAAPLPEKASLTFSIAAYKDDAGNAGTAGGVSFTTRALPPTVTSTMPAAMEMNVTTDATVSATFSRAMDMATLTATSFTLTQGTTPVMGTVAYDSMTRTATLTPLANLLEGRTYSATLTVAAKDSNGTALAAPYAWNFTTGSTPPTVTIAPADMALDVPGNQPVVFTFSEAMDEATLATAVTVSSGGNAVPGNFTWDANNRTYTFVPTGAYPAGGSVVATVAVGATDISGIALAAEVSSTFSISTAPAISMSSPGPNEMNVALDADVTLVFTVPMDAASLIGANVRLEDAAMAPVAATYSTTANSVRISPAMPLVESSTYTIVVTTSVRSAAQIAFPAEHRQSFTTVGVPPVVSLVSPADNASGVALNGTVRITFDEDMDTTTFTGTNVRLSDGAMDVAGTVSTMDARNVVFTPSSLLRELSRYTVIADTGLRDVKGNALASTFRSSFVTEALPRITSVTPAPNEVNVPQSSSIIVAFNKPLDPASVTITAVSAPMAAAFTLDEGTTRIEGTISWEATSRTVRIIRTNVGAPLAWTAGRRYVIDIDGTKLRDLSGNTVGGHIITSFVAGNASDTTPPTVTASSPGNGDTGVSRSPVISADFSEAIDASTLNGTTVQLLNGATPIAGRIDYSPALKRVSFVPSAVLPASAMLSFSLSTGIKDMSGNAKAAANTISFTTDLNPAPSIARVTPANGAMNVNANAKVRVDFSEAIEPGSLRLSLLDGTTAIAGNTQYDAASRSAVFTPLAALPANAMLTLTVASGLSDSEGATLTSDFTSAFTTIANSANDVTRPFVTSSTPSNMATGVRARPTVALNFSEAMNASTVTVDRFTLQQVGGPRIPFGLQYDLAGERAVLTPSISLTHGVTYEVLCGAGLEDLAGNEVDTMAVSSSLRFTVDATGPTVITRTPAMGSTVGSASRVEVVFSEDMDAASIDAATFSLTFSAARVLAAVSYDPGTRTAVLQPAASLSDGVQTVTLDGMSVRDLAGNTLSDSYTFTVSSQQPAVVSATPCGTIVDVYDLGTQVITLTFDRPVRKAGGGALDGSTLKLRFNNVDQTATVNHTAGGTVATITPSSPLTETRTYEVQATTGVVDNATGVALSQLYSCTFQTQRVVYKDLVDDTVTTGYTIAGAGGNTWQRVNSPDDSRNSIVWRGGNATDGANYTRACALVNAADYTVAVERTVDLTGLTEAELRYDEFHLINSAAQDRGRALVISGTTVRELASFTGNASGYTNRIGQGTLNLRDFVGTTVRVRFELLIKGANMVVCGQAPAGSKGLFVDNLYVVGK
ncbi:MAG: Ig-like domain-containing protein [Archangium sp.]